MKYLFFSTILFLLHLFAAAQTEVAPTFKGATKANRDKTYDYIVNKSITKYLSQPLSDSTEEDWEEAFYAMELIQYKQPWVNDKIKMAFDSIDKRSAGFQRALMELCYTNYPDLFKPSVKKLLKSTHYSKIFALCSEYLYQAKAMTTQDIRTYTRKEHFGLEQDSILNPLVKSKSKPTERDRKTALSVICSESFLKNNTIVFSFQRKNRNYPGIAIVRDRAGNFIKNDSGKIFAVTQLAKSLSNLPYYLTNGNTPQGIFRMFGFDVSKSPALGPTQNIQLTMPLETSVQQFLKDSTITDSIWTAALYQKILPESIKGYFPLLETYYASKAGRTEIIAHGTTVDPEYYKGQTYYPYTPTQGCLCTKETWSLVDGKRVESDQQKLVNAVKKAGGADGYFVVIEIDDQQKPVSINEILPFLK